MSRPRRGESPAEFVAREVRREHRPDRAWPPALGGLLAAAGLAMLYGPEVWADQRRFAPLPWWGGVGLAALGLLICRGVPRWMSLFLLAACLLFAGMNR